MPSEKDNILKFNQYMKPNKMPHTIYDDLESLLKKIDGYANNPGKSSTRKRVEHIPCVYSMSAILVFDYIENKHTLYYGEDCKKKLTIL